jgi:hypothetical protein
MWNYNSAKRSTAMSEDQPRSLQRRTRAEAIEFEGDQLIAVRLEGEGVAVPVREICLALGLDIDAQSARLREHEVLSRGLRVVRVRYGDRIRSLVAILHKYIPFWLATISPHQVKEPVRAKLIGYQIELVDLLAAIYGGDLRAAEPAAGDQTQLAIQQRLLDAIEEVRLAREALLAVQQQVLTEVGSQEVRLTAIEGLIDAQFTTIGGQIEDLHQQLAYHTTITGPQQETIKRAIQRIATRYKHRTGQEIYDRLFSQFRLDLGTPRYDAIPAGRYQDALDWLRAKAAEYLPDDPEALPPLQEGLL